MGVTSSKVVGFNADSIRKKLLNDVIAHNNKSLVDYAKKEIRTLGDTIAAYNSRNNMDDTGNLLDSLCWCVCYDGKMVESGFYREKRATLPSYLHELSKVEFLEGSGRKKWKDVHATGIASFSEVSAAEDVHGHERAAAYLEKAPKKCKEGQWMLMFAILAPYWGYWEAGHRNVFLGNVQFAAMTQFYDRIQGDLKPMKTSKPHIGIAKYASKSLVAQGRKNLKHNTGTFSSYNDRIKGKR